MDYKDKEFWEEVNKETAKQIKEDIKKQLDWTRNNRKEALEKKKRGEFATYLRFGTAEQTEESDEETV